MTGHTAGPWRFRAPPTADNGNPWVVMDRDSHVLAIVPRSPREANARLMAAAPELLEALKEIREVMDDIATDQCEEGVNVEYWNRKTGHGWQTAIQVCAAIDKAEGRQPVSGGMSDDEYYDGLRDAASL